MSHTVPGVMTVSSIDFVLVTALPEELDAVLAKLPGYRRVSPDNDDIRTYFQSELPVTFPDQSTGTYQMVVMCLPGMGRVQAVAATADAIRRWRPRYILLVGIAGGMAARNVKPGDILISDQIVDYELQAITPEGPRVHWEVQRADPRLLNACNSIRDESWQALIQVDRIVPGSPSFFIGPIASGDKVIAFGEILTRYRDTWPKLMGVEMEAAGAATAAFQSVSKPGFFMVRGVSELADKDNSSASIGSWRAYACDIAASFAIALLKSGPVPVSADHPPGKTKQVQLIIEGEVGDLTQNRQQDIIDVLAALLKIDTGDIRILKVSPGSVVITIEMPESAAEDLYAIARRRDSRIMNLNIKAIQAEGKEMIQLDDNSVAQAGPGAPELTLRQDELAAARQNRDSRQIVEALIALGAVQQVHGQIQAAVAAYQEAVNIAQEFASLQPQLRQALYSLGLAYVDLGNRPEAIGCLREAEALSVGETQPERKIELLTRLATALGEQWAAALVQQRPPTPEEEQALAGAMGYLGEALQTAEANRMAPQQAELYYQRGYLLTTQQRYPEARLDFERAGKMFDELNHPAGQARILQALGALDMQLGQLPQAMAELEQALRLFEAASEEAVLPMVLAGLAQAELMQARPTRALPYLERAQAVLEKYAHIPKLAALQGPIQQMLEMARAQSAS